MPTISLVVQCTTCLQAVIFLKDFYIPEEAVCSDFIDKEDLTHSSISGQVRSVKPSLIGRGQNDKDLDALGFLHPDYLPLQVEVLGAVVSEDHDQGALRGVLESHQEALGQPLPTVSTSVKRLKDQARSLLGKSSNIRSVNLVVRGGGGEW